MLTNRQLLAIKNHLQILTGLRDLETDSKKAIFEKLPKIDRQLLAIESQKNMIEAVITENEVELTKEEKTKRYETFLSEDSGIDLKIKIPDSVFHNYTIAELSALLPLTE